MKTGATEARLETADRLFEMDPYDGVYSYSRFLRRTTRSNDKATTAPSGPAPPAPWLLGAMAAVGAVPTPAMLTIGENQVEPSMRCQGASDALVNTPRPTPATHRAARHITSKRN